MSSVSRSLFTWLNVMFGASVGAAISLLMLQDGAWSGRPSPSLLAVGAVVVFGAAYVVTATARGQRVTPRGLLWTLAGAAGVVAATTLTVSAPGWVLVWTGAGAAGLVTGWVRPLAGRSRRWPLA